MMGSEMTKFLTPHLANSAPEVAAAVPYLFAVNALAFLTAIVAALLSTGNAGAQLSEVIFVVIHVGLIVPLPSGFRFSRPRFGSWPSNSSSSGLGSGHSSGH